jgi:hypothetical protein
MPNETILVADRPDMSFQHQIRLHHVSGDYWVAYYHSLYETNGPANANKAEFKAGVDGKPTGFEMDIRPIGEYSHGVVFFEKME